MSDVYKIGVSLMMTSNAAGVLKLLGAEILGVHAKLKDLNKGLLTTEGNIARLNRIKLAVGGGVMMGAGIGLITGLKHVTDHARELSHELVQLEKMNIGSTESIPLVDALKQVQTEAKKAAEDIKGVTRVDALKAYGAAYSMFGHKDSMKMIQPMLRFSQVAGNTGGNYEQASSSLYQMIRAGDLMGKFVNERTHQVDTDKLNHFLELGSKVMLGTHGKVNAQAWLSLAQQGGPALSGMSDQGLYTMAIAAQAMGGPRAGTALTSLYQQMVGGKMTDSAYNGLEALGLASGHTIMRNGKKVHVRDGVDHDFQERLKTDPIQAVELMQQRMKEHGFDTIEKQVPLLFNILGRQTTQRLVHDLLRNMPQILGERERTKNALGVGASKDLQDRQDYTQAEQNLKKAWEDLMIAVAGPNSQTAINIMNRLTDAIRSFTKYIDSVDPAKIEMIGKGLLTLGAALTAGGAVALLAALGPAGWLAAGIATAGVAFANYKGPFEHWLKSVTGMGPQIDAADKAFNAAAVSFGKWVSGLGPSLDAADKAFNNFAVATGKFVSGLVSEISTWPSRIEASITAMGAAIVEKIKGVFTSILSGIGSIFSRTSFEGGGEGMGGLIHRAGYGGGGLGGSIGGTGTGRKGVPDFGGGAGGSGSTAFDAIMRAEGTAGKDPYNVVLGNGKYGLPDKPLTDMTLREAYAFGRRVRARHGSSSALGAFQIVGRTMKSHMGAVGLGWDDKFTPENQRKLARDIARTEGLGAWEGFKSHPHERARARSGGWNNPVSAPPPPVARDKGEQSVHLHVDGQKIASIVTRHQFRDANRPAMAASMMDGSLTYPRVG